MINVFSPLQSCLFYHFTIIFYYPVVRTHEQNVRRFACGNCRPEQKVRLIHQVTSMTGGKRWVCG